MKKSVRTQKKRLAYLTKEMIRVIGHNSSISLSDQTKAKGVYISDSTFRRWAKIYNNTTRIPRGDILTRLEMFLNLPTNGITEFLEGEGDSGELENQVADLLSNYEQSSTGNTGPTSFSGILLYISNHATLTELVELLREVSDRIAQFAIKLHQFSSPKPSPSYHQSESPLFQVVEDWCKKQNCTIDDAAISLQETYGMSEEDVDALLSCDREPTEEEIGIFCLLLKSDDGRPTSAESLLNQLKNGGGCHVHS